MGEDVDRAGAVCIGGHLDAGLDALRHQGTCGLAPTIPDPHLARCERQSISDPAHQPDPGSAVKACALCGPDACDPDTVGERRGDEHIVAPVEDQAELGLGMHRRMFASARHAVSTTAGQEAPQVGVIAGFLVPLIASLRRAGVPVSSGEALDAAHALECTHTVSPWMKLALRSTLIKRPEDIETFDEIVEWTLAAHAPTADASVGGEQQAPAESHDLPPPGDDLLTRLAEALQRGDTEALAALAADAVAAFGDLGAAGNHSERSHVYRVLRRLDLAALLQRALRDALRGVDDHLERAIVAGEVSDRIELLRRHIAAEVRLRYHLMRSPEAASPDRHPIDEVEILEAGREELLRMRAALRPLTRRLAARARRGRERLRTGRLDFRRTVRASLSTGGVPLRAVFRKPRISRPELVVLCDLSGSMAEFAGFMIAFITAISQEMGSVRIFAFVDGIDDVTELAAAADGALQAAHLVARANVVEADGHSDYGRVFTAFTSRWPDVVTSRSTVLVAGDARTNHRPDGARTLAEIAGRARALRWFNPEPMAQWGTTDSAINRYRPCCDSLHEVRNLRQLEQAVDAIVTRSTARSRTA